jgi:uncharacterized delta-60 repeat protein
VPINAMAFATGLTLQPDGKLVILGVSSAPPEGSATGAFALERANADGSIDSTFGTSGIVTGTINGFELGYNAVALQSDGKIVMAGTDDLGNLGFVVRRFNSDGSSDPSFTGDAMIPGTAFPTAALAVLIQPDGGIVVGGLDNILSVDLDSVTLLRFTSTGSLDTTFGTGGAVLTDLGGPSQASAIALAPDGKLIVTGSVTNVTESSTQLILERYTSSGALDSTFGSGGTVSLALPGYAATFGNRVVLQPDGKIVVGGAGCHDTQETECDFVVARFLGDAVAPGKCGDGVRSSTEQCDDGPRNGTPASCCSKTCQFKANGAGCDDGNACTRTDTCQAGVCTGGSPVTCSAADQCHVGACNPASGQCTQPAKADGAACDDGNACTHTDTCQAGVCTGGSPVTCAAADQCHAPGTCDPATGACTTPAQPDGTPCNDGNACTQHDACQGGVCTGNLVTCSAADQCHDVGACDPSSGQCTEPSKADGAACDDNDPATLTDGCQGGSCQGVAVGVQVPGVIDVSAKRLTKKTPIVVTLNVTIPPGSSKGPTVIDAAGFAAPGGSVSDERNAAQSLIQVTNSVHRVFRHKRKAKVVLRLNALGRKLLQQQGSLSVTVNERITDPSGHTLVSVLATLLKILSR